MDARQGVDLKGLFEACESHQMAIGFFDGGMSRHEPKSAPGWGLSAASWLQDVRPVQAASGLAATSVRVELVTRIYMNMLAEDEDRIDPDAYAAADVLMAAYHGDFTLDGMVRNVDLLGAHGEPLRTRAGYIRIGGSMYRTLDVITPLILNDVWTQSP